MELRIQTRLTLAVLLSALVKTSSASASFPAIQPIVGFSTSCTLAYDTPVSICNNNDFQGIGGTGTCSADCEASLIASQVLVQRLCSGQQADGNSVIGHLFSGDIVNFLCGDNSAASTTTMATQATTSAQSTMSMPVDTTPPATSTGTTSSVSTAATLTSSRIGSASKTTLDTSTSTKSLTASSSTSSSIPTSIESATGTPSTTSSPTSATTTSKPQGSDGGSGGGSPFDTVFISSATSTVARLQLLSLSCLVALTLAIS